MAGNSQRRGATRTPGSKKGPTGGTGGKNRRSLEGRGPTPKAEERTKHPAAKRAAAAARSGQGGGGRPSAGRAPAARTSPGRGPASRGGPRGAGSTEVVAGRNAVVEALRAGVPASSLHLADRLEGAGSDDRVREVLRLVTDRGLPVLETTRGDLDRLADGAVHQGVVLRVPPYEYTDLTDVIAGAEDRGEAPLVVALDSVTDPRNLGAVVRSAAAFGAHGVLVPERRSAGMTASAWKVSAGAAARLPVARETNLTRALQLAQERGCFVVGLDADADAELGDAQVARIGVGPLVLVVGSEGKGLSRLVRATCDLVVSIPMAGQVESLNASVAAGVALYAVAQARRATPAADRLG